MDLATPSASAAQAYATAHRFVPLQSPPASPAGAAAGPRFDLAALTGAPPAGSTPIQLTLPAPPRAAAPITPPRAASPPPADLTTLGAPAGPPSLATLNRAAALYGQTLRLATPVARAALKPPPADAAGPSSPGGAPDGAVAGSAGLGGAAESPTARLGIARGSFVDVMI